MVLHCLENIDEFINNYNNE